ncbi:MAG: acyltransferase [Prevotella sp.]|nr:acyltransferase [Prevotella sp.]
MKIDILLYRMTLLPAFVCDRLMFLIWKRNMKHCGEGVNFHPLSSVVKGLWNLSIGDGAVISRGCTIYCTNAPLIIGRKVGLGPNPTIMTGDHRIDIVGKFLMDVTEEEKLPENDQSVVIEDGVWCGSNVTILKGVILGHDSIVASGAVVTKSFPPYSIIGGVPAKLIKMRFTEEQIREHERLLYGK